MHAIQVRALYFSGGLWTAGLTLPAEVFLADRDILVERK
jgi:hypothetical protein